MKFVRLVATYTIRTGGGLPGADACHKRVSAPTITKENLMAFVNDFQAACTVVDRIYGPASYLARTHNLKIGTNRKLPKVIGDADSSWVKVLEIEGTEPEYRIGFSIHLSPRHSLPGTAHVWSLVTDLKTGNYNQFIRDNVPLAALEETALEGLTAVDGWIKANGDLDPITEAKRRAGTAFYWSFNREKDGTYQYTANFNSSLWKGIVCGDGETYEGTLTAPDGTELAEEGENSLDLIKRIEDEYKRRVGIGKFVVKVRERGTTEWLDFAKPGMTREEAETAKRKLENVHPSVEAVVVEE
jgi:hypothetical protein